MLIIGITGTLGAGKGTIVDYLVKRKKHSAITLFRAYLIQEIKKKKNGCKQRQYDSGGQ